MINEKATALNETLQKHQSNQRHFEHPCVFITASGSSLRYFISIPRQFHEKEIPHLMYSFLRALRTPEEEEAKL